MNSKRCPAKKYLVSMLLLCAASFAVRAQSAGSENQQSSGLSAGFALPSGSSSAQTAQTESDASGSVSETAAGSGTASDTALAAGAADLPADPDTVAESSAAETSAAVESGTAETETAEASGTDDAGVNAPPGRPTAATPADGDAPAPAEKKTTSVSIESAKNTEYRHNKETGVNTIILTGDVCISVSQGSSKTTILADAVTYERERNMLYAEGNVTLKKLSDDKSTETLTARTVLFNTDTQEGIFDGGRVVQAQSDALNLPAGSTMIVASEEFGRNESGSITFKNANLTFCDDPEPHWRIKSRRLWLLPGNEFSFLSGLLYVGQVPILYIPFFYYPKDEMIFNPVFGYRKREGYFMQTTTYIVGRKPLDTSDSGEESFFDFLKTTQLKKQVREGLFFRNLEENDTAPVSYMKIYADLYSNLGAMIGLAGILKPKDSSVSNVEFVAAMGFSHTLTPKTSGGSTTYTPYNTAGELLWDKSGLFGLELPFRYFVNFKAAYSKKIFNVTLTLPFYSDYKFNSDFMDRSETMDWINFLTKNPALIETDETTTASSISSFTWSLSGSVKPVFKSLAPYINTLQISNFSSSMAFSSKTLNSAIANERGITSYSPEYYFYYPYQFAPIKATMKISGTLFSYSSAKKQTAAAPASAGTVSADFYAPDDFADSDAPAVVPGAVAGTPAEPPAGTAPAVSAADLFGAENLPEIAVSVPTLKTTEALKYSLTYDISPAFSSLITYNASSFNSADDISLEKIQNLYYTVTVPVNLTSSLAIKNNLFSMTNGFTFTPYLQDHPILWMKTDKNGATVDSDGYYTYSAANSIRKSDYSARKLDLQNTNTLSLKPFVESQFFSNTSLSWNSTVKLVRMEFDTEKETSVEEPHWSYRTPDWGDILDDSDSVTAHSLNMTFASNEGKNYSQSITFQANLPPQVDSYLGKVQIVFPFVTFSAQTTYKQTSETDTTWIFEPFTQSTVWNFFSNKLKLTQSFTYDIEDNHATALKTGLTWNGLQISYAMQYTAKYKFNTTSGWSSGSGDETFLPYSLTTSYALPVKKHTLWKRRIDFTPGLSTSLYADLVKPTNSYLTFEPSLKFTINEFLDITFSTSSRNNTVFKYVNDSMLAEYDIPVQSETNFFTDLWNSFAFWDTEKRTASAFKLKSFSLKAEHNLHDWNLTLDVTIKPRTEYNSDERRYEVLMDPYISLSVIWRPMSSMKTSIVDKYGDLQLNPDE